MTPQFQPPPIVCAEQYELGDNALFILYSSFAPALESALIQCQNTRKVLLLNDLMKFLQLRYHNVPARPICNTTQVKVALTNIMHPISERSLANHLVPLAR